MLFAVFGSSCSVDTDCGSADTSQPGLCRAGFCQCGVCYVGNQHVDPTACSRSCSPPPLGAGQLPLDPTRLNVFVRDAHLVVDVTLASFSGELPEEISLLRMPFEPSLCWDLHESSDANVLMYRSGLEIVQRSAAGASFNQVGHRATTLRSGSSAGLSRTFRKEVVINVQHHATLHSNAVKSAAESPPT